MHDVQLVYSANRRTASGGGSRRRERTYLAWDVAVGGRGRSAVVVVSMPSPQADASNLNAVFSIWNGLDYGSSAVLRALLSL